METKTPELTNPAETEPVSGTAETVGRYVVGSVAAEIIKTSSEKEMRDQTLAALNTIASLDDPMDWDKRQIEIEKFKKDIVDNPTFKDLLPEILDRVLSGGISKYQIMHEALDNFLALGSVFVAEKLLQSGTIDSLVYNLEKFHGLDHQEIAHRLIDMGAGGMVAFCLEKFHGLDHKKLAEELIDAGDASEVAEYINKFYGMDRAIAERLIDAGLGNEVYKNYVHYEGIEPYITRVDKYLDGYLTLSHGKRTDEVSDKVLAKNISTLLSLEHKYPGSVDVLIDELGIKDLGRYPENLLVDQLKYREDVETPYGILAYPVSDYNGAFHGDEKVIGGAYEQLQNLGYHLRILPEADSIRTIATSLIRLDRKYGKSQKISFAIIGGHGTRGSIKFGDEGSYSSLDTRMIYSLGITKALKAERFFTNGAPIALISCSTGSEWGIAQAMSTRASGKVTGPTKPANVEKINFKVDENGILQIDVMYSKDSDIKATYYAGDLQ